MSFPVFAAGIFFTCYRRNDKIVSILSTCLLYLPRGEKRTQQHHGLKPLSFILELRTHVRRACHCRHPPPPPSPLRRSIVRLLLASPRVASRRSVGRPPPPPREKKSPPDIVTASLPLLPSGPPPPPPPPPGPLSLVTLVAPAHRPLLASAQTPSVDRPTSPVPRGILCVSAPPCSPLIAISLLRAACPSSCRLL